MESFNRPGFRNRVMPTIPAEEALKTLRTALTKCKNKDCKTCPVNCLENTQGCAEWLAGLICSADYTGWHLETCGLVKDFEHTVCDLHTCPIFNKCDCKDKAESCPLYRMNHK